MAPPYTTICIYSTLVAECAALGDGGTPFTIRMKIYELHINLKIRKYGLTLQLLPSLVQYVVHESLASHRVLSSIACCSSE